VGSSDCDPLFPVEKKSCAGQLFDKKVVLRSGASGEQKGLTEEQELRKNKRRNVTWGYSTAERANLKERLKLRTNGVNARGRAERTQKEDEHMEKSHRFRRISLKNG
jgi:hypothetical protein